VDWMCIRPQLWPACSWFGKEGKVQKQMRTFGTTTRELLSQREWLLSQGCTHVAMESTGIDWKPVLEGAL